MILQTRWIKTGLVWGIFMLVTRLIRFPYFDGEEFSLKTLLVGLMLWAIG